MSSDSAIKHFTRGGQVFLHNLRMISQVASRVGLICLLVFMLLSIGFSWAYTSTYEQYLAFQYLLAKFNLSVSTSAKQAFINPNGITATVHSNQIVTAHFVQEALAKVYSVVEKAICVSLGITLCVFYCMYRGLRRHGQNQSETKQLRGDEIFSVKKLSKQIKAAGDISDIQIANLILPNNFECRHVLIHGTTGSGKSVSIRELLDQIRQRGDRAIIYDKSCSYIQSYFQEGHDIILNPLDERTSSWHLWDECRDSADFDSLAAALIPMPTGASDPFWVHAARTIFAASARQMKKTPDACSMIHLLKSLLTSDLATMEQFLRGTEAEILVSEKIEKTAISIKSVLATYLKSLKYVKDEKNPFSIRRWIQDDTQSNWLFISSLSDRHETLKPLISMWLDLALNALMSLTPSSSRRIWVMLDELPTLQKLPYLSESFAESRKFGGCLVAGVQSIAQLRKTYGNHAAEEISGLCNTRIFFREPSFDTAQWVSRELGQAEVEEVKEGISYGETAMRSGISITRQQTHQHIVNPSEIMRLNDLEAYIRIPGSFPITKLKLNYKQPKIVAHPFVQRKIDERSFNEINTLIESLESQKPSSSTVAEEGSNKLISNRVSSRKKVIEIHDDEILPS